MQGDRADMAERLRAVLPVRWFPQTASILAGLLTGLAQTWSEVFAQLDFVRKQTRILTASGPFLDLIAADLFGVGLARRPGQTDTAFRTIIVQELFRPRATRSAVASALTDLTGRAPIVFEPARTTDTGGWNVGTAWGLMGGWGSLNMPFQFLVTAYRPSGGGIAGVAGWGQASAGWGAGAIEWGDLDMLEGQITDEDISRTVAGVLPVSSIAWLRISN